MVKRELSYENRNPSTMQNLPDRKHEQNARVVITILIANAKITTVQQVNDDLFYNRADKRADRSPDGMRVPPSINECN